MIKITKYYEELIPFNAGTFKNAKIGITLSSDKELTSPEEIKKVSNGLLAIAKSIVKEEVEQFKTERGITNE